jgi:hypothetical protein
LWLVLDVDPESDSYASVIGFTELPHLGDPRVS